MNASSWIGGANYAFPQGRNVTGYQFNDDFSWVTGNHTIKLGYTFRRDDITDYTPSEHNINFAGGENFMFDEGDFAAGWSDEWAERFPQRLSEPVALYTMGVYAQDQWKPRPNLTVTYGLRIEHDSNPLCRTNCVSTLSQDFSSLPSSTTSPYNQLIASGREQAFFEERNVAIEPRFGFSFLPGGADAKTTIRGGFGMFADYFPAQIMGDLMSNMPNVDRFTVTRCGVRQQHHAGPGLVSQWPRRFGRHPMLLCRACSLRVHYYGTQNTDGSIACPDPLSIYCASGGVFTRPTITTGVHIAKLPVYEEWSLAVEREIAKNTVFSLNYIGNRSYHQPVSEHAERI